MKKNALTLLAAAALTLSLASCGEKLLTPEQVDAAITQGFEAGKAAVESAENSKCDAAFEQRVQEKVNALDMAAQEAAKEAMPAGSK
ncbi:MAG TPA: hypothetical protein PK971_11895 [Saprospiraceae bacterium]|nr:hypothetical protein [Saprospiraceae bacterium]HNG90104.1 hypothetical protein [Saprospiraceae bacterium]